MPSQDKRPKRASPKAALPRDGYGLPRLLIMGLAVLAAFGAGWLLTQERKKEARIDNAAEAATRAANRLGDAAEKIVNRLSH